MRLQSILWVAVCASLAGCVSDGGSNVAENIIQSSVFAKPAVVYHTGDNLEVSYYNGGIQQSSNERTAMELLKKECGGAFRITGRSNAPSGDSYVDAVCVR
jgi:Tfp pilus assembly protein PilX